MPMKARYKRGGGGSLVLGTGEKKRNGEGDVEKSLRDAVAYRFFLNYFFKEKNVAQDI